MKEFINSDEAKTTSNLDFAMTLWSPRSFLLTSLKVQIKNLSK